MSWAKFEADAAKAAARGRQLMHRNEIGQGLLVTIRGSGTPRIHPVYAAVRDGRLLTFADGVKAVDLEQDGRYAFHTHVHPDEPSEFMVRGHARRIDGELRERVASTWDFDPGDTYRLFELLVESALLGERADADAWPPIYTAWKA